MAVAAGLEIGAVLETLGSPEQPGAAGSAAALAGALAAAAVTHAARASNRPGASAQAVLLRDRLARLAQADAEALAAARSSLAAATPGGDERRDFALGRALRHALSVPLRIAETCADLALLAGDELELADGDHRPDLYAAAAVAAGAARAAAHLVVVNLTASPDDPDVAAARRFAASAADVVAGADRQ